MFYTIWEFTRSADWVVHSENSQITSQFANSLTICRSRNNAYTICYCIFIKSNHPWTIKAEWSKLYTAWLFADRVSIVVRSSDHVGIIVWSEDRVGIIARSADCVGVASQSAECVWHRCAICRLARYLRILKLCNAICGSRKFKDHMEHVS